MFPACLSSAHLCCVACVCWDCHPPLHSHCCHNPPDASWAAQSPSETHEEGHPWGLRWSEHCSWYSLLDWRTCSRHMDEAAGGCDCRVVVVTVSAHCTRQPPARATSLPWPIDTHSMYIRMYKHTALLHCTVSQPPVCTDLCLHTYIQRLYWTLIQCRSCWSRK